MLPILVAAALVVVPLGFQITRPQPFARTLEFPKGDRPLLQGAPQTAGTVGWHTTGQNEESLVILHGEGEALIDGQPKQVFAAPAFACIPLATRQNISNTGNTVLEYVYLVALAPVR